MEYISIVAYLVSVKEFSQGHTTTYFCRQFVMQILLRSGFQRQGAGGTTGIGDLSTLYHRVAGTATVAIKSSLLKILVF